MERIAAVAAASEVRIFRDIGLVPVSGTAVPVPPVAWLVEEVNFWQIRLVA